MELKHKLGGKNTWHFFFTWKQVYLQTLNIFGVKSKKQPKPAT